MIRLLVAIFALLAAVSVAGGVTGAAGAAEIKDHPAVSRYPGSVLTRRDDIGHAAYNLVVGVNADASAGAESLETLTVEGDISKLAYENPKDKSAHEIFENYKEGLEAGGFEILFSCVVTECAPSSASGRWAQATGMKYFSSDMRYLAAKHSGGETEIYVAILVATLRHQVEIVEATELERGLVTAKALADGLLLDGRAVLDGIVFDTDKATIKPESKAALETIAAFLAERPDMKVYIVGHTDSVGGFDHNMALSRSRAEAVVKALVTQYGVDAARLAAHGVGPLSPAKTNRSEAGKTSNRRVEMVER